MKSQSRKAKGRRLQQWTVEQLGRVLKLDVGNDAPSESRPMGQPGSDVRMESWVVRGLPLVFECKNQEKWRIGEWMKELWERCEGGRQPVLVVKRNYEDPYVVIDARWFFWLIGKVFGPGFEKTVAEVLVEDVQHNKGNIWDPGVSAYEDDGYPD